MGRSGAAKNKQLRENRQDLVQNLLAAKNGDLDLGQDYGISRKEATEKLKLTIQDLEKIQHAAWVSYNRGQQGVYYPEAMIRELVDGKPEAVVPSAFVSEASVIRSVTKAERTQIGFPENYRHIARFGKIRGQRGPHTYCYPKDLVEQLFPMEKEMPERASVRFSGSPATEDGTSAETPNTQKSI